MSEGYIGLAPSYGVFEKQVIAGTTATSYPLDFDVVQSTQVLVSLDGIVQEPDFAYSVGRDSAGAMQITFSEALAELTNTGAAFNATSSTITVADSSLYTIGQSVTGHADIPASTFISTIPNSTTFTISNSSTNTGNLTSQTIKIGSRIFVTYLGKQLLTPSANNARTFPKLETFTGVTNQVNFDLPTTPPSAGALMIFVDGVFQRHGSSNAWTLAGAQVQFSTAPAANANISVMHLATEQSFLPTVVDASVGNAKLNLSNTATRDDSTQTGSGWTSPQVSDTTWTISAAGTGKQYAPDDLLVHLNGICLVPTLDYTVSGTTLTLTGGVPPLASSLVVRYLHK
jgi:hypothetical protein